MSDDDKWVDTLLKRDTGEVYSSVARIGEFRLTVHRHVHYPSDMWLASCADLFSNRQLASKDLAQAKTQAMAMLQVILEDAMSEITA